MDEITMPAINMDVIRNLIMQIYGDSFNASHFNTLENVFRKRAAK